MERDADRRLHDADDVVDEDTVFASSNSSSATKFLRELKVIAGFAWPTVIVRGYYY